MWIHITCMLSNRKQPGEEFHCWDIVCMLSHYNQIDWVVIPHEIVRCTWTDGSFHVKLESTPINCIFTTLSVSFQTYMYVHVHCACTHTWQTTDKSMYWGMELETAVDQLCTSKTSDLTVKQRCISAYGPWRRPHAEILCVFLCCCQYTFGQQSSHLFKTNKRTNRQTDRQIDRPGRKHSPLVTPL